MDLRDLKIALRQVLIVSLRDKVKIAPGFQCMCSGEFRSVKLRLPCTISRLPCAILEWPTHI